MINKIKVLTVRLKNFLHKPNWKYEDIKPEIQFDVVTEIEQINANNQVIREFKLKQTRDNGNNIVKDPIGKVSGVDHQFWNAEVERNKSDNPKEFIFDSPLFIEIKYINIQIVPPDSEIRIWEAIYLEL